MLRQSYTAVVERANPFTSEFATEPYEAGWASEAVIFIKIRDPINVSLRIEARVQISPDGIDWVDEGTSFPAIVHQGSHFVKVTNFGNWLRVAGRINVPETPVAATVYMVLKE